MNVSKFHRALLLGAAVISVSSLVACASAKKAGETAATAVQGAATDEGEKLATDVAAEAESQATAEVAGMAPDKEKLAKHAAEHITYPADKAAVVAACADTPEFTEAEKVWVGQKLPEGEYASDRDLLKALDMSMETEGAEAPAEEAAAEG